MRRRGPLWWRAAMADLGFLFRALRRGAAAFGAGGAGQGRAPVVFPADLRPGAIVTHEPEPVLYSMEENVRIAHGPPKRIREMFDKWLAGNSSAILRYRYQPYRDQQGRIGSIWVQFVGGRKQ